MLARYKKNIRTRFQYTELTVAFTCDMTKAVGLRSILDNTTFTRWNIFKASLDEFKEGVFTPFFPSTSRSWSSFVTSNFFWNKIVKLIKLMS